MTKTLAELAGEARGRIREIGARDAAQAMQSVPDLLVLDVREPEEYRRGHLHGALHIPRGLLEPKAASDSPGRVPELSRLERPLLVYCGSGLRSAFAADVLQILGFSDVRSLAGGIAAWQTEGLPIEG